MMTTVVTGKTEKQAIAYCKDNSDNKDGDIPSALEARSMSINQTLLKKSNTDITFLPLDANGATVCVVRN